MKIDKAENRKVHMRRLAVTTYTTSAEAVIVEGTLTDECFVSRYYLTGEKRPPGYIHDMVVRMKVRGPGLVIEAVDVEMPTVPRPECLETIHTLDPLVGMPIASGFTQKVKEMMGGPKGCTHLASLVLAMAPAAVQGAWTAVAQRPVEPGVYADRAMNFLTDTCWVWRKGGPFENAIREQLDALAGKSRPD